MNLRIAHHHEHSARRDEKCPSVRDRRLRTTCHSRLATDGRLLQHELSSSDDALLYHSGDDDLCAHLLSLGQEPKTKVLISMPWGLGDAVQLTCILQHLAKHRPDWSIDMATGIGKHTAFAGLCRRSLILDRDHIDAARYNQVFDLNLYECYSVYEDSPCTKVCNCLREVFGIKPEVELLKYRIAFSRGARRLTGDYLRTITGIYERPKRYPVVAIHYQGNTSPHKKDLPNDLVYRLCQALIERGFVPLILDWDWRSPLPDQQTIFCPTVGPRDVWGNTGTGDAERLTALISQCALMIGVDSGPLHIAGATDTPTLGVWTGHGPLQFYDLCSNVTHLVPVRWREIPPCQHEVAARFFEAHYAYRTYENLEQTLIETAIERLDRSECVPLTRGDSNPIDPTASHSTPGAPIMLSNNHTDCPAKKTASYGRDYYAQNKANGLDLLAYGSSQEGYGYWLVDALGLDGRRVLDVGCACGSKLRGLLRAGADMQGVDCSEFLIDLGRRQWPELCDRLFVVDAVNLHCFPDNSFDWLHARDTAEHWRPELVPFILAELLRIAKPGGSFYCAYESDPGAMVDEPTQLCLKPASWWEDQVRQAGWQLTSCDWAKALREHPHSFFPKSQCAWFVARKPTSAQNN